MQPRTNLKLFYSVLRSPFVIFHHFALIIGLLGAPPVLCFYHLCCLNLDFLNNIIIIKNIYIAQVRKSQSS